MKSFLFVKTVFAILIALAGLSVLQSLSAGKAQGKNVQADTWTWRGPQYNLANLEAPQINQIILDPTNPSIVYAATNQGVYRSANGGESWEPRNHGLGGYGDLVVNAIAMHPSNPQTLIIGTWGFGLFRSTDSGGHWTRLADPVAAGGGQAVQASGAAPPAVRAGGASNAHRPAASHLPLNKKLPPGLAALPQLQPDRQTYQTAGLPRSLEWTPVNQVTINPQNPNEIFASIAADYGLYRSTDGGASWSKIQTGVGSAQAFVFAPSNPQVRYASFSDGIYQTIDGGGAWILKGLWGEEEVGTALAVHPTNPNLVMAGSLNGGLYRSTDGGTTWDYVSGELADTYYYSIAFAPSNPDIVYAGGYYWIYRSTDGGESWEIADTELFTYYIKSLAIHPAQPNNVLMGAAEFPWGGVYHRTSASKSFELKSQGMQDTFILDVEQDPYNANTLYAATWGAGVFRSSDGGDSWSAQYGVPYVYSIEATQGVTGTLLYAGTFYTDWGVLKSFDQGDSWQEVSKGYASDISFDLQVAQGNPDWLVAATYQGIQFSIDGGLSWYDGQGLDQGVVLDLCEFPDTGRLLAATYGGGIYASPEGVNWYPASQGISGPNTEFTYAVNCSPAPPGLAYAGSLGVFRSLDYGEHWQPLPQGLPNDYIREIDLIPGTGDAFATTNEKGVYIAPAGIAMWFPINNNLAELRTRAILVATDSPQPRLLVGTNGRGVWDYLLATRPAPSMIYLPLSRR